MPRRETDTTDPNIEESIAHLAVPIGDIISDPANVRKHGKRNLETIKGSLAGFRQQKPIVVGPDNICIAGNGTLEAARALGWSHIAVVRTTLKGSKARAFAIADNRTAELAEWDDGALAETLAALQNDNDIDEALTGFTSREIESMINTAVGVTQDDIPAAPEVAITRPGDIITLGNHRLICGDATNPVDVARVMGSDRAVCIVTDPPYGVSIAKKNRLLDKFRPSNRNTTDIVDDDLSPEALADRIGEAFNLFPSIMSDDCTVFMTVPSGPLLEVFMAEMRKAKMPIRHILIWKKNQPTFSLGHLDYDYQHEPILMTWGKRHKRPMGGMHKTSVWEIDRVRECKDHPTIKPVELYANAYLNNSDSGDIVFDAYAGSGTAFIAAEQTGRACRGVEISPPYCDVVVKRWEALTGKTAERIPAAALV